MRNLLLYRGLAAHLLRPPPPPPGGGALQQPVGRPCSFRTYVQQAHFRAAALLVSGQKSLQFSSSFYLPQTQILE